MNTRRTNKICGNCKEQWRKQIDETRQIFNKYYDKAVEEGDCRLAEVLTDIRMEFEEIDDKYVMQR